MFKMGSHDPFGHLKHKLWPKERLKVNLTPDHKMSRITLIYLCVGGVPQIIIKLLTRATTLLWTSPQSKVCTKSYGPLKLQESQFGEFWESQLGSLETK
jgi:hypothetical protein